MVYIGVYNITVALKTLELNTYVLFNVMNNSRW